VIESPNNEKLKLIRRLAERRGRDREDMFAAEGEDLVEAAAHAGVEAEFVLRAGEDVEPELLDGVSALGSGTRVIGVYRKLFSQPGGRLSAWLDAVSDPGNIGTIIRSAHALCDGPVTLGPGCADPFSPKAVRASMGSVFARPPAYAEFGELRGLTVALDGRASETLAEIVPDGPVVLCLGSERDGLSEDVRSGAAALARIATRSDGPESLNVAMAASIGLHELANRMARHV
jgi:TrmH family RNA methyltransferase